VRFLDFSRQSTEADEGDTAMALITRMSRLFRADVNAVLDRIEEPAALLRQSIREMEEDLAHDEQRARLLEHEQRQLDARLADVERALRELAEQLDTCFDSGKDDLARTVIRRRLEAEQQRRILAGRRDALAGTRAGLGRRLDDNRRRLDAMRQKSELLADGEADRREDRWSGPDVTVRDEDVEVALLHERQRRAGR
jgi:phage shock protein A